MTAPTCPACHRPLAVARPTCLYCGAALPEETAAALKAAGAETPVPTPTVVPGLARRFGFLDAPSPASTAARILLVVELRGLSPDQLGPALGLPAFEAGLRARQGGFHLHLAGDPAEVDAEGARLEAAGLRVLRLPEAEVRTPALLVTGGDRAGRTLRLFRGRQPLEVVGEDVFLVVEGPIQREYQSRPVERNKMQTATLEAGHRFHLHRRNELPPVELDPSNFSFGTRGALTGSSLLEMKAWIQEVAGQAPVDDAFRRLPPALSPAAPEEGAVASLRGTGTGFARAKDARAILDNVAQFRFYSGWRAAVERRRIPG